MSILSEIDYNELTIQLIHRGKDFHRTGLHFESFDSICRRILEIVHSQVEVPMVILLAGFPCTGKTTVSKALCQKLGQEHTLWLEAEYWLKSRSERSTLGISGCSVHALNLSRCVEDMRALFMNKPIFLQEYCHYAGKISGPLKKVKLGNSKFIILDGLPFLNSLISEFYHHVIFFLPELIEDWHRKATIRDVAERYYTKKNAEYENYRKAINSFMEFDDYKSLVGNFCFVSYANSNRSQLSYHLV